MQVDGERVQNRSYVISVKSWKKSSASSVACITRRRGVWLLLRGKSLSRQADINC